MAFYALTITRAQADHLLALVGVAELAIGEHHRVKWLPTGLGDATLMTTYLKTIQRSPSLEHPLKDLRTWIRTQPPE
ncbi:MAG TPA: hypothetical protein VGV12_12055 [Gemmatimonadales bacterium]|nr:hypothetical protein [Gemmatimonadales bacterium]